MTNKMTAGLRKGLATALLIGLAACSDDTPTGGLLNQDGDSGGVDPDAEYVLALDGPTCVPAGRTSDPFTALLTTTEGEPVPDVFVLIEPFVGDEPAGTITATAPDGRQRVGGANTDSDGEMVFTYRAPSEVRTEINVSMEGSAVVDDDVRGEDQLSIRVPAQTAPTVRVQGPIDNATGNRIPSGSLEVEAGELASEFLVTVTSSGGCDGASQPVRGANVEVQTSLTNSVIRQTDNETLLDGTAVFDYLAPSQVTARTADVLTVFGSTAGGTTEREYTVFVLPGPPDPYARLTVRGPTSVPAGTTQSGYIATAEQIQEDSEGNETVTALPDVKINLSSSDSGSFTVQTNSEGLRGVTDDFGIVRFGFRPAASGNTAQTVDLTAAIETASDATAQALCSGTAADCTDSIEVQVQADTFTFTAPDFGDAALVGANNAVNLEIDWRDGSGAGVTGCVDLSTTFDGASGTSFGLIINNDPVTASQTRRARVVNGEFEQPHALYSDRSGFVTVIAEDNRDCASSPDPQLEASTGVQFQDEICTTTSDGRNCVDLQAPLRVLTSPDDAGNQRTATLTFEVRNNAFQPIDGAQVTFEIITAANAGNPNERVFPGGGTTNASGIATSRYFVPTFNPQLGEDEVREADVRACVRRIAADGSDNGQVCSTRRIEIVAPPTE